MDRRKTTSLDGKCGSCRFFALEQGRECTGFCSGRMKHKGRLNRTYKCIGYEKVTTVIPTSDDEIDEAQRDYQEAADYQQYCEMYEQTYDPETGAM